MDPLGSSVSTVSLVLASLFQDRGGAHDLPCCARSRTPENHGGFRVWGLQGLVSGLLLRSCNYVPVVRKTLMLTICPHYATLVRVPEQQPSYGPKGLRV